MFIPVFSFTGVKSTQPADKPSLLDNHYGNIVWYTLVTPNLAESMEFYQETFGWEVKLSERFKQKMAIVSHQGKPIASMVEIAQADAALWIALVSSPKVSEVAKKFTTNGGRVILKPFEIDNTGKQVILEGPLGEKLGFIENAAHPISSLSNADKEWIWTELWSDHPEQSKRFYEKVLSAKIEQSPKTSKPYLTIMDGESPVAAIISNPLEEARSQWAPYVNIQNLTGFYEGLKKSKAKILLAPDQNYRDGKIIVFEDPHNALVCVQKL